jgi:hypothetical protein
MLYPSETSRKPLEAILVRLKGFHRGFVRPEFASVFGSWSFWSFGTPFAFASLGVWVSPTLSWVIALRVRVWFGALRLLPTF